MRDMVEIAVIIQDNRTKETVSYLDETICNINNKSASTYIWEEGNYSCDCNRKLFFNLQKGIEDDGDNECSDGKYSVCIINPKTKEILYDEIKSPIVKDRITQMVWTESKIRTTNN